MSNASRITALATRIATEVKTVSANIPQYVIATTGSEARPNATKVLWLVSDHSLTLTNKQVNDPVLLLASSQNDISVNPTSTSGLANGTIIVRTA